MAIETRKRKAGRQTVTTWRVKWRLDGTGPWQSRTCYRHSDAVLLDAVLKDRGYAYRSDDRAVATLSLIGVEVTEAEEYDGPAMTLRAACLDYADRTELAPGSRVEYTRVAKGLPPSLGETSVATVTARAVNRWIRTDRDAGVPSNTMAQRVAVVKGALRANGRHVVAEAVDTVKGIRGLEPVYLTEAQVRTVLTAAREVTPADFALGVEVAVRCGLRTGEVWALTPRSVGPAGAHLVVSQAVHHNDKAADGFRPGDVKGQKVRTVPVPRGVAPRLQGATAGVFPLAPLFKPAGAGWWTASRVGVQWAKVQARAAELDPTIPALRFHDLRHTAAKSMLTAGVRLEVVSEILGHHSVEFTKSQYWRFTESDMDHARALMAG